MRDGDEREALFDARRQELEDLAYYCIEIARDCEAEAKRLRKLSNEILYPPEGVTVEPLWGQKGVRFVGPVIGFSRGAAE